MIRRCVVVGGAGAVGSLFAARLREAGTEVCIVDNAAATDAGPAGSRCLRADVTDLQPPLAAELNQADLVLLAVPEPVAVTAVPAVLGAMSPGALLVDTLSVKARMLAAVGSAGHLAEGLQFVSLNPMFGPSLGFDGHSVAAVVVRDGELARELLRLIGSWGAVAVRVTGEDHDRLTAATQALTHAAVVGFGTALARLKVDPAHLSALAPPPHAVLLSLLGRIASGVPAVYWEVQSANPNAGAARAALADAVKRFSRSVDGADFADFVAQLHEPHAYLGERLEPYRLNCARMFSSLSAQSLRQTEQPGGPLMSTFAPTVLSSAQRSRIAADETVGGGNLLSSAIAVNPHPDVPFLHSHSALVDVDGQPRHNFSLLQLDRLAQSWSVWYRGRGVKPRDRVAVWLDDSFAYSVHFHALAQIGAIAVLVNSNAPAAIARPLIAHARPVGLYTDRARLASLGEQDDAWWSTVVEDLPAPPEAELPDTERFRHAPEDPVALLHSSGTTGRPKLAIHTHRSIAAGPKFRLANLQEVPGSLMMTALPQSHLGCIAFSAFTVLGGTPVVALRDCSGQELADAIREHQPTGVMSFPHSYSELAAVDTPPGALDSVNIWVSIGDAVHDAHMRNLLSRRSDGKPPAAFYDRLGTTELGWGVFLKVRTLEVERNDRCAGKPVGVADAAVLRRDGSIADANEIGLLGAMGPAVTVGYWDSSDLTYEHRLSGYWLTGDMAYRNKSGEYFLVDRAVDTVDATDGTGYSVLMEEVLINEVPDIHDVAVVAGRRDGRTVPVAVVTAAVSAEPEKLLTRANELLAGAGHPCLAMLEIAQSDVDFPVGVTGKVLKRQLREKYAALDAYLQTIDGKPIAVAD